MSHGNNHAERENSNPTVHDNVFKWAISTFVDAFFPYYAEGVCVSKIVNIDKEFIQKYEPLKESIKDDLFLIVEVEIDDEPWGIVILIELKSKREDVHRKMREYMYWTKPLCGGLRKEEWS